MNTENLSKCNTSEGFDTEINCPLCKKELTAHWQGDNIPYFGEVMYVSARCTCGFRFADTMILTQKEPMRYEINIDNINDLNARVVRSISGTIRIPELGIDVEPGSASEAYVTNVEGVLLRAKEAVESAIRWFEDDEAKSSKGRHIKKCLEDTIEGKRKLTLIIDDPLGNSAIISDKATSRHLSEEESKHLSTGMFIYDANSSEIISKR
ncbi:ZPR1-related zinc finger protein [Methanosalsum zhilinae DSM 4017]|uniref:ZPR1-related zinc finger protein n=1 Tax=Methanosalsum zhilinae (strain DSM 4017 / NBRC 107636 / OCM 62 / WeN5) TaxID=679901 RepID=F7XLH4_METZD|nr:ZPR1 zinc finger domain-containing protein [Methanosalsum zhilinae]AEH60656.1 ZPR1-related zinc finger protein [Methanosalsum zhilinae DSM 4017]